MKSGFKIAFIGLIISRSPFSCSIRVGSKTCDLYAASYKLAAEMSHPQISKSIGLAIGTMSFIGL